MGAELEAGGGPGVEVGLDVDGATDALLLAHTPVLVESRRALDRRLVHPLRPVDVVRAAVRRHRAKALRTRAVDGGVQRSVHCMPRRIMATYATAGPEQFACPAD